MWKFQRKEKKIQVTYTYYISHFVSDKRFRIFQQLTVDYNNSQRSEEIRGDIE